MNYKPKKVRVSPEEKSYLFQNNLAWCAKCKTVKPVSEMTVNKTKSFGIDSNCKVCENLVAEKRRALKRERLKVDEDYASQERDKENIYRRQKRAEKSTNTYDSIVESPLTFKPAGKKVSNVESKALRFCGYKWCSKCSSVKLLSEFNGGTMYCRECLSQYVKNNDNIKIAQLNYYEANKNNILKKRKIYRQNNPDKIQASKKKYYFNNKDVIIEKYNKYRAANIDRIREVQRVYSNNNREKLFTKNKEWRTKNLHNTAAYWRSRYKNDEQYKLRVICRQLVRRMVLSTGAKKNFKSQEILGYTPDQLKAHITSKFKPGMSWDNYGEWHIDHIIPISSATTFYEGLKLSQLDNLQPLWAEENLTKGCKIE